MEEGENARKRISPALLTGPFTAAIIRGIQKPGTGISHRRKSQRAGNDGNRYGSLGVSPASSLSEISKTGRVPR